ncbi:MAG TPA: T9SS type A sorting domain-containing protein [Cytophagaceae bacterium]
MLDDYLTSNEYYYFIDLFMGIMGKTSVHETSVFRTEGKIGDYAVRVKNTTQTVDGEVVDTLPGFVVLALGDGDEGLPYNQRPAALTGYYKFTQGAPSGQTPDTARIYVNLIKGNIPGEEGDSIGGGYLNIYETTTDFTFFTIDIGYIDGSTPDTLYFGFFSTLQMPDEELIDKAPIYPETELILDDIALTGVTGNKIPLFVKGVKTYPNPVSTQLNIANIPQNAARVLIMDFSGKIVDNIQVASDFENVNTSAYPAGLYHYSIYDVNGEVIYNGKINVVR